MWGLLHLSSNEKNVCLCFLITTGGVYTCPRNEKQTNNHKKPPNTQTKQKREIKVSQLLWLHYQVYSKNKGIDMKDSSKKNEILFVFPIKASWTEAGLQWSIYCLISTTSIAGLLTMRAHSELHPFKCQGFLFLVFETGSSVPLLWHRIGLRSCKPLR